MPRGANTVYTSETRKNLDFNKATKRNSLLLKTLLNTGQLMAAKLYYLDSDH